MAGGWAVRGGYSGIGDRSGNPDFLLGGTSSGQVFVSENSGDDWRPAGNSLAFPGWVVNDLLFDAKRPNRVWAALRGMWAEAGFVAVSDDRGKHWYLRSQGIPDRQVYALAQTADRLYAATRLGVFGSDDDGQSWRHLTAVHEEIQKVTSLLVDPQDPKTVFAGTWRRAYRSDDGGESWQPVFSGMALDSEVFSLHSAGKADVWASTCGWVYRSRDGGGTWERLMNGLQERRTPSFQVLSGGIKLAGTVAGIYRSTDEGRSWRRVTPKSVVALTLAHHPDRPQRVFVGTEGGGVWRSDDGGGSFTPASRGMSAGRVSVLAASGDEVLAVVRDGGPASGLYSSFDGGRRFTVGPYNLPRLHALAVDGANVWAASDEGLYRRGSGRWQREDGLGERRVQQVVASGGLVVVRSEGQVFLREHPQAAFTQLKLEHGDPRKMAVDGDLLWILADKRLFRVEKESIQPLAAPVEGGDVYSLGGKLLVYGKEELWRRDGLASPWTLVGRKMRLFETGDREYPLLLVERNGRVTLLRADGVRGPRLELSVPARDLEAALLHEGELFLGTAGHGVLKSALLRLETAVHGAASATATGAR